MIRQKIFLGDTIRTVTISSVIGAGGDTLQLLIDNYYQGSFVKTDGLWRWMPQNRGTQLIPPDDVQILIDLIKEHEDWENRVKSKPPL